MQAVDGQERASRRALELLAQLRSRVSPEQQELIDELWTTVLETGHWPERRLFYSKHRRDVVLEVLGDEPLGGAVAFEDSDPQSPRVELTFLGVLLSSYGPKAEELLIAYLNYVRQRFENAPSETRVTGAEVRSALNLDDLEARVLGQLVRLGNLWGGSAGFESDWQAGVPTDQEDLPSVRNLRGYVAERAIRDYAPGIPMAGMERSSALERVRTGRWITPSQDQWEGVAASVLLPKRAVRAKRTTALSPDSAIEKRTQDRLGRAPFAQHLARVLRQVPAGSGFVVALHGPWGSGKTSVLNLVEQDLSTREPRVLVVRFNPLVVFWRRRDPP